MPIHYAITIALRAICMAGLMITLFGCGAQVGPTPVPTPINLLAAAETGDLALLRAMAAGATQLEKDEALLAAIKRLQSDAARELLSLGASARGEGDTRRKPLLVLLDVKYDAGSMAGQIAVLDALLLGGADANQLERDISMRSILRTGGDPRPPLNDVGDTPLNRGIRHGWPQAVIEKLVTHGARITPIGDRPTTHPIHWAIQTNRADGVELTRWLLARGASPNTVDGYQGLSPLCQALTDATPELVSVLIGAGARVNPVRAGDCIPLLSAAASGDVRKLELLLAAGVNLDARDEDGLTVWNHARAKPMREAMLTLGITPNRQTADWRGPNNDSARWWSDIFSRNASAFWLSANLGRNLRGAPPWNVIVTFDGKTTQYEGVTIVKFYRVPDTGLPELQTTLGDEALGAEKMAEHQYISSSPYGRFYLTIGYARMSADK